MLASGARLGPYEIAAPLGAGGMGEVYRAKDTRLDRSVALKVLPRDLSADPELRARFTREARAISALGHPHICALFDVGSEGGLDYLVMELLEGETLADRIARGPLPTEQVLRYGREIADALDRAHRGGIVHRDLKPGNVMLTKSGVKLLDFGLAKVAAREVEAVGSNVPTRLASQPLTEKGTVLGTFQYMAPEQLEGKDVDARADIFALGAVLHEMATGNKAFHGASRASLIAAILTSEPPAISTIQKMAPPALDRLVKTCLAKDPDDRWQSAHDVAEQLRWIAEGGSSAGAPAVLVTHRRTRERIAWALAAALALAAAALAGRAFRAAPTRAQPIRFTLADPERDLLEPALSPDGSSLVSAAIDRSGHRRLVARAFAAAALQDIPDTDGALAPFFSPDGRSVAFFSGGKLRRVALPAGPSADICDAEAGSGTWTPGDTILLERPHAGIVSVPAGGGVPRPLTTIDASAKELEHLHPQLLPDGRRFLYTVLAKGTFSLVAGDLGAPGRTVIGTVPSPVAFAPPRTIVYTRGGRLVTRGLDPRSLALDAAEIPIASGAGGTFDAGVRTVAFENTIHVENELVWVDRSGGGRVPVGDDTAGTYYFSLDLARGERYLSYEKAVGSSRNIWIADLARHTTSRLTFGATLDDSAVFSPDGTKVAFDSNQSGTWDVWMRAADGSGSDVLLVKPAAYDVIVNDWSKDGRYLLYGTDQRGTNGWDLWVYPFDGDHKPFPFLATPFREMQARISPDVRHVAYTSNETGRMEVYVQRFPGGGEKVKISTAGGLQPMWRADGKELFYLATDSKLMAVPISTANGALEPGTPAPLFEIRVPARREDFARNLYAPAADGKRFVVNSSLRNAAPVGIEVLVEWPSMRAPR